MIETIVDEKVNNLKVFIGLEEDRKLMQGDMLVVDKDNIKKLRYTVAKALEEESILILLPNNIDDANRKNIIKIVENEIDLYRLYLMLYPEWWGKANKQ